MVRHGSVGHGQAGQGEAGIFSQRRIEGVNMAKLNLHDIVLDWSIYPRTSLNEMNIDRLAAALQTGAKLPAVTVDATSKRLVDGWHRYEAHKREGADAINATLKTYASEADLFADAVRLNIEHGQPLDPYSIKNAIIRLEKYGYQHDQIGEVVRLPVSRIEKIERGFAASESGEPLALKGGLSHMRGSTLTPEQQEVNRRYGGPKATFHLKQLSLMLETDMHPRTKKFAVEMDRLVGLWAAIRNQDAA
jgi:hypothetical protein